MAPGGTRARVCVFPRDTISLIKAGVDCSSANKCLLKVAAYAAQLEQYQKAIEIYEQVRTRRGQNSRETRSGSACRSLPTPPNLAVWGLILPLRDMVCSFAFKSCVTYQTWGFFLLNSVVSTERLGKKILITFSILLWVSDLAQL